MNGSNVFFNIEEISLVSEEGYKESFEKTFKLVTDKQKLYDYEETYNLKLTEKLYLIEKTYSSKALKCDFKTIYGDLKLIFIWKDGRFYGSNIDRLAEMHNDKLKEKRLVSLSNKQQIL